MKKHALIVVLGLTCIYTFAQSLGNNPEEQARAMYNAGSKYWEIRDYDNAKKCYLEALKIRKTTLGERHQDYIKILQTLGDIYYEKGDYTKAEEFYLNALSLRKQTLGNRHPQCVVLLNSLGLLYIQTGDYVQAQKYNTEAISIQADSQGVHTADYASTLFNLGILYTRTNDFSKAEECLFNALSIRREILGDRSPEYAATLNAIANMYATMGDNKKAEAYYREAKQIQESALGQRNAAYASSLAALAYQYMTQGNHTMAEKYYLEAIDIYKSIGENHHPDYAALLNNLGNMYMNLGDNIRARDTYLEAIEVTKSTLGIQHPNYSILLINLANIYSDLGDNASAIKLLLEAQSIQKTIFRELHPDYALLLYNLGFMYLASNENDKAEETLCYAMQIHKKIFLSSLNFMTEEQRASYWHTLQEFFYEAYPYFVWRCSHINPSISTYAYDNELFTKGLLLTSTIAVKRSILESGDGLLIAQWDTLTQQKQKIISWQTNNFQSREMVELLEKTELLEKEITKSSATYRLMQSQWDITWDSIRSHLRPDETAIEIFVTPFDDDRIEYCALILRSSSLYPELITLFEEKDAKALISRNVGVTYSYDANGKDLSDIVWQHILPNVKPGETIYFAPSGLLHQLSIEALPYDETHTLGDMFNIVRLSSTREIALHKHEAQHATATLYGGIQYQMDSTAILAETKAYKTTSVSVTRSLDRDTTNRGDIRPLPWTKTEVESIYKMLQAYHLTAQLYTSTKANEESFKAISGKHQNILHIATHGFYWADSIAQKKDYFSQRMVLMDDHQPTRPTIDPLNRCGLLFAGAQTAWSGHSADLPNGVQDGILTAKEISLLDLRDADLVVLSACETGRGEVTGEGVFGLQRAFKMAGAQTIVMSLWPVNDAATQLLMTEFYKNWITLHQSKRVAFRNAQNTVRKKYEEPVYWAGFVMLD